MGAQYLAPNPSKETNTKTVYRGINIWMDGWMITPCIMHIKEDKPRRGHGTLRNRGFVRGFANDYAIFTYRAARLLDFLHYSRFTAGESSS